ncbi:MAG: LacI family DNA-binding transcriptional regulator [Kiritimatiellae bacterium]|nr:LacI family DNA-binding transcriptional regulator [Kiritimatiellia bacterium]MBQ3341266.1 LacI family DNA-binding transcriptional regulator [Kiritimatiellia bacterium]
MEKWKITIDRKRPDLVGQFVEAVETGIEDGRYTHGDKMPTIAEWKSLLGVSAFVPRRGIGILAEKGLVSVRRHVGAIVNGLAYRKWLGKVLFVTHTHGGLFHDSRIAFGMQTVLEDVGYEFSQVHLPWQGKEDGIFRSEALLRHLANGIDFAIVNSANATLCKMLVNAGVKYMVLNDYPRELPKVTARLSWTRPDSKCARQLADYWRKGGVKSVLIVDFKRMMPERTYTRAFYDAGISVNTLNFCPGEHVNALHDLPQAALEGMKDYIDRNLPRKHLPDAIFFYDDFLAMGGLTALAACGLTDPANIRIATISNRGFASFWFRPLTRVEYDPISTGNHIARFVLDILKGRHPRLPTLKARFIRGNT